MPVPQWMPWRSVWLPRTIAGVVLVVAVPLFLRMPPWCDITLYQMAGRNILHGGTHYRDLFDTNLPGFVWAITALYAVFGPSALALRAVDLLIVTGVVALLDRMAKWGGASRAARWWVIAGAVVFYPFTVEMAHAQRDTWMALPALAAIALRVRRGVARESAVAQPHTVTPLRASFVEGVLWGFAVWMKPHAVLMAATVWLLSARRIAGENPRPWRALAHDLLGNVLGGVAVGLPGLLWLVASGTWGPFVEVFTMWNPWYVALARTELADRMDLELHWFPPWSLCVLITVPLALVSVLDAALWSSRGAAAARPDRAGFVGHWLPRHLWDKQAGADARFVRGVLGGLYIVWAAQALVVQRGFQYVHVPETFLMLGIWASHRWAWAFVVLLWIALVNGLYLAAGHSESVKAELGALSEKTRERYVVRHPLFDLNRLRYWPQCFRPDMTDAEVYALRDRLQLHPPHEASIGWQELNEVAEFLRSKGIQKGDKSRRVIAWFDSPHAIYLILDLDPGIPYMHVFTVISIPPREDDGRAVIGRKIAMDAVKANIEGQAPGTEVYLITDLEWTTLGVTDPGRLRELLGPPVGPNHLLPHGSPFANEFPFNQPTVFRSRGGLGRYVVHRYVYCADDMPK